jgi:hypothetical protein
MNATVKHIAGWLAAGAIGGVVAVGLSPIASADATVHQNNGNAEVTATPGEAAHEAAQQQQPFGGQAGALIFHH